jgi:hypothetical protein
MKQRCHTWIALRAIDLIQNDTKTKDLAEVLKPWVKYSYIGCWLPDMQQFKKGHGIIGNHTFKNKPYAGPNKSRFVLKKDALLASLDLNLSLRGRIASSRLGTAWWNTAYKADQKKGEHLPDCLASLSDTIADMLLLGDPALDGLVPGSTGYAQYLDPSCALSSAQVATFFFIISHYVADCFMPLHADARKIAAFTPGGLHEGWEKHWDELVGTGFDKTRLATTNETPDQIIARAKALDVHPELGLSFPPSITWEYGNHDFWDVAIFWCRASFALSCEVFPVSKFPFGGRQGPQFKGYFTDQELKEYDRIVLQSAVYSVAGLWKQIWRKFS